MSRNRTRVYLETTPVIHATAFKLLFERSESCSMNLRINSNRLSGFELELMHAETDSIRNVFITSEHVTQLLIFSKNRIGCATRITVECPICNMNRALLYFHAQGLGCRTCFNLHYKCQSETDYDRLLRRIRSQRIKVWGKTLSAVKLNNLLVNTQTLEKPKGSWGGKYLEGINRVNDLEVQMAGELAEALGGNNYN